MTNNASQKLCDFITSQKLSSTQSDRQIDGMDPLIDKLGEAEFIKLAIESSYFFSKDIVKSRHDQIVKYIEEYKYKYKCKYNKCKCKYKSSDCIVDPAFESYSIKRLPARISPNKDTIVQEQYVNTKTVYFYASKDEESNENPLCEIYQDGYRKPKAAVDYGFGGGNGNTRVCQLIKNLTGYNLGAKTEAKSFKNYVISHIWGNAVDPRYFTNLWNIVLVPEWASHLLDKNEPAGTLSSKLKATIMKICDTYFQMKDFEWGKISLSQPKITVSDVFTGDYMINVIEGGNEISKGNIKRVKVEIK